jgi:integrase
MFIVSFQYASMLSFQLSRVSRFGCKRAVCAFQCNDYGCLNGHRDATIILIPRASELCDLQWHQVELASGRLHVRRTKRGTPRVHPMQGDEIRALRRLRREQPAGPHVFASERGGLMASKSFHTLIARLGEWAKMPFPIHPH